ncbi:CACTA en-spm transposon protein [Cucumis melo var. makuwa]|uniref:CACTA en-spm transposon protein n=1 Tax=Cucumis melo var. makuwa TaxID=1194695 RepID=A0A5A7V0Y7_CUCMM|nr:CACTA en-spm transposon protein [Cucumis melo var. makuwa]TYK18552.1 CACTA en-spm transposon protein [Cucumis melo var. makuwa]
MISSHFRLDLQLRFVLTVDALSVGTMSSFPICFQETDDLFLKFGDVLNNNNMGSSSVSNISDDSQPTPTPRRRQYSQNMELERYVQKNGKISITIAPRVKKPTSPHSIQFSNTIGHELTEERGQPVGCVNLFRETHANRSGQFISHTAMNAHNQMLELQSQPTLEGSQPLFGDEICKTICLLKINGAPSLSLERVVAVFHLHIREKCTLERLGN